MPRKDISDYQVCIAAKEHHATHAEFVNEILARTTGEHLKVCNAAISRAMDRGFVECGVSERTCWVTDDGEKLIIETKQNNGESCSES